MGNRNYSCGDTVRCSSEGNTQWIVIGNVDSRLVNCVQGEEVPLTIVAFTEQCLSRVD